ncbi:hypothetical protein [Malikia sp.]|uniref:hypothetical protein n=1 Tax=Malikia sp. TaxID=2070706 RepID=UPI00261EF7DF|nr:hypothetical protein [Malikia sp.]MDD2728343.1 hypothetical protein [Malikia sp.]
MKILGLIASVALLAGCAAAGVKVTDQQLSVLKPGESTEAHAAQVLGKPTVRTRMGDGTTMLTYSYYETKVRPETFIPFAGAFIGGSDSRSTVVTLNFDQEGKLLRTSSTESTFGSGMGIAAGAVSQVPTEQPKQ